VRRSGKSESRDDAHPFSWTAPGGTVESNTFTAVKILPMALDTAETTGQGPVATVIRAKAGTNATHSATSAPPQEVAPIRNTRSLQRRFSNAKNLFGLCDS